MQRGTGIEIRKTPPGLVATIAAAVSAFLFQPLPILIPIAVDLVLWSAPRLSPAHLLGPLLPAGARTGDPALVAMLEELSARGTLAMILGLLVPSLLVGVDWGQLFAPWSSPAIDPGGVVGSLIWLAILLLPGVVLAMTFRVWLARVVRDLPLTGRQSFRAIGLAAIRYFAYLAMVGAVVFGLALGAGIVWAVFMVVGIDLLPLLSAAMLLLMVAGGFALAFVPDAIALLGIGPLRAIAVSLGVVRRYPWSAAGLIVGVYLASLLAAIMLGPMVATAIGLALAILAYAFLSTVLGLTRMRFLADRLPPGTPT